jgi:DNA-binding response OmpR family regulator
MIATMPPARRNYLGTRVWWRWPMTRVACVTERQPYDPGALGLMLPDADGLKLPADSRRGSPDHHGSPRGTTDRVVGLGRRRRLPAAFDRELLARCAQCCVATGPGREVAFGRLEIDKASRQVRRDGQDLGLTARQHDLLVAMAERAGRVLTRDQLIDLVGADGGETIDRSIDVHIAKIRAAIEDDPHHPRRIITVRGAGYVFAKAQD